MKLDINEVYHQYIIRMVVFAVFLFKRQVRQPNVYRLSIDTFLKKRMPWKINLYIDLGDNLSKANERDLILDDLLEGVETNHFKMVNVIFTTPLKKDYAMQIDISAEEKYTHFLYS